MNTTPPTWRGFSFALHPDTVQGFCFARMQYSPIQAFTTCFAVSMQLYRPRHKTVHRALQGHSLRLYPLNRPRYQTDKSGYNTTCATLENIHAPGRAQPIPDTTATPGRCTGQNRPSIIIMYIRARRVPAMDPCQTVQHIADHASPAASRCFQRPAAGDLAPGQWSGRASWHPPPGGAVQRQRRGGRRGTIDGCRRISFRAFAR